ncbi:ribonuclease R [Paenibacillus sp. 1_12]|uniref:ribonuclease R n=1 Tax=Paenibacillus sp. 1_12 TaxID=1566278 RepID=UPI0008F1D76D|nr:ribonuclease R [Paenibacillus sp. 1_12]SFM25152.1 ribonuclease R [Paenibacillus sp. 1_12]
MIQREQLLEYMKESDYKPMTYQELEKQFQITGAQDFKSFLKLLNELENDGHIVRSRTERYGVPERMNLLRGRLQAHAKGFGFLIPEDRDHPDVYIHANDMGGAMNGDTILVRITTRGAAGGKLEGEVAKVVTRANTQIVGLFQMNEGYAFVLPDDKRIGRDIFIPKEAFHGAMDGHKVVVHILSYPEGRAAAEGEVIEILGHKNDPGVDIISIIRKHRLPESFPDEVLEEATSVPEVIAESDLIGRRDLRSKRIVTIDGEDAKDLDDAVNVERLDNGNYVLGVHIADVSYYVREGSPLDREAYNRGCSVYLVDRVIPMLPHRLSNGICSLNPQVDRLTMSCEMEFDENAKVVRHDVFTSVIKTSERMTYTNVRKLLSDEPEAELLERYAYLMDDFRLMQELAGKLRNRRMKRGAIDFDFEESKILVDASGKPTDIVKRERAIAEQIIEEFMLAANETVAEHFHWLKVPFLYRIHEDPDNEKLQHFMEFITNFGYTVRGRGNTVHPQALQSLLNEIKGTKEERVISTVMLRSMKQAKYDALSTGHFGLAAEFYSHFTSPIRRYPDLIIHRVIREVLEQGDMQAKRHEYLSSRMEDIAKQSSERERVAVDAERETEALKKAEFMMDKVGEEFEGMISSVTSFGIFVELDNTVEGLIRLSDMHDDYYHYHEAQLALIGERTSKVYRLGDEVKVRVARVSTEEHTIDFEMVDMQPRQKKIGLIDALKAVRRGDKRGGRRGEAAGSGAGGRGGVGAAKGARGGKRGKGGTGVAASGSSKGSGKGKAKADGGLSSSRASSSLGARKDAASGSVKVDGSQSVSLKGARDSWRGADTGKGAAGEAEAGAASIRKRAVESGASVGDEGVTSDGWRSSKSEARALAGLGGDRSSRKRGGKGKSGASASGEGNTFGKRSGKGAAAATLGGLSAASGRKRGSKGVNGISFSGEGAASDNGSSGKGIAGVTLDGSGAGGGRKRTSKSAGNAAAGKATGVDAAKARALDAAAKGDSGSGQPRKRRKQTKK